MKYDYYLAGPISHTNPSVRAANLQMFGTVAHYLRAQGRSVFSPPENEPDGLPWADYLRRDIPELLEAEAVYLLPGWQDSKGACLEAGIAQALGVPLVEHGGKIVAAPSKVVGHIGEPDPKYTPVAEAIVNHLGPGRSFSTGSVRDTIAGKGRFDLLPARALREVAKHFQRGAEKYGERNWEKGQPIRASFLDSGFRHLCSVLAGETNEDHLVACAWNILCAIDTRERVAEGLLPQELNDL